MRISAASKVGLANAADSSADEEAEVGAAEGILVDGEELKAGDGVVRPVPKKSSSRSRTVADDGLEARDCEEAAAFDFQFATAAPRQPRRRVRSGSSAIPLLLIVGTGTEGQRLTPWREGVGIKPQTQAKKLGIKYRRRP